MHQGKLRYLGCSNFAAWQLARALWVSDKRGFERFESVQPEYNFGRREIESELSPLCLDQRVSVIPYLVLMGGILTGAYDRNREVPEDSHLASRHAQRAKGAYWNDATFDKVDRVKAISAEIGCEPTQLVLAWALAKPAVASVIVGASRPEQVVKNAESVAIEPGPEVLEQLDNL